MDWNHWLESLSLVNRSDSLLPELPKNNAQRFVGDIIEEANRELQAIVDLQDGVAICTSPADGAEISALAVRDGGQWHELLYRANEFGKVEGWPGRAPWLWPVAGRCYTAHRFDNECTWEWDGVVRPITRHGFVRHQAWQTSPPVVANDGVSSVAHLRSDGGYRQSYPFNYHLTTRQRLSDSGLQISYRVEAASENISRMPFNMGLHFTFNFLSWWGKDWLQGEIEGLGPYAWHTDNRAQITDRFELPTDLVRLGDSAFKSAIVPARANAPVKMVSPDGERKLEMSFTETSGVDDGDLVWVSYVDSKQRFFCLEPWVGWPNALNSGRGRVALQPGESWEFKLQIAITSVQTAPKHIPAPSGKETTRA